MQDTYSQSGDLVCKFYEYLTSRLINIETFHTAILQHELVNSCRGMKCHGVGMLTFSPHSSPISCPRPSAISACRSGMFSNMFCKTITSLMAPNLLADSLLLEPIILPLPPGSAHPPPSASAFLRRFSTCTRRGLMMPVSLAPRPVPCVQPYLDMRRWAKSAWPGRFERC